MTSRKKQSDGIALLSMYNDEEDEDMEDLDERQEGEEQEQQPQEEDYRESNDVIRDSLNDPMVTGELANEDTPSVVNQNSTPRDGVLLRPLTPQQPQGLFSLSPRQQQERVFVGEVKKSSRGKLTIVDYAHDEVAMSPEPEEGELGEELQNQHGAIQEKISPGTVQVLTPASIQATPQSFEHLESSQPDEMNKINIESEHVEIEVNKGPEQNADPLDKFLPPPPKDGCPDELQKKIDKFLSLKKVGRSFNAEVRNRKDYRNPDFLLHAVRYQDIDQIGTCFSKDVFDPHGYDKSDFYDAIEADMRREKERKEQELKKSPKVEFVPGGTQPGIVVPPSKFSMPIPVAGFSGLLPVPTAADTVAREGRQSKKSKWDKVDGDGRNPLSISGQDSLATVAAHAALLSAANAGTGYSAFMQQKQREAEERRSSERKLDRRS